MMNDSRMNYENSINNVLNHIQENLSSRMDLNTLAQIGRFSPFHFHRLFKIYVGESIGSYIKRKKLEQAAHLLSYSNESVSDIGYQIGYETPSSLSTAFQKQFNCTPTYFRKHFKNFKKSPKMKENKVVDMDLSVRFENLDPMNVIFVRCKGYNPESIGKAWNTVIPFAQEHGVFNDESKRIGIAIDNPDVTSQENCEYNACLTVKEIIKTTGEVSSKELKGGKYAVFTHRGAYDNIDQVYSYIFKKWLMDSTYELRDGDIYDQYMNSIINTAPEDLITEIHIPIK
jgi:AraC family transcriptional regulator